MAGDADLFESAWLKWAMAVTNVRILEDNIRAFASQPDLKMPTTFATYYDAKRHCIPLLVSEVTSPLPVLWGVLLGEVAHDYRCCLDHVAWALYKRGRTPNLPPGKERKVSWPIFGDRIKFNQSLSEKLPEVRRRDLAIVRHYQPYKPGKSRAHRHVFTVLQEFANTDKHRAIQRVIPMAQRIDLANHHAEDCIVRRISPGSSGGAIKPGAELARFYVKKDGRNPRIAVQPHFTLVPAIHELLTVQEFLDYTMNATAIVLQRFAEPPRSALALLGAPIPPLP